MKTLIISLIIALSFVNMSFSQTFHIKGNIIDKETKEVLPGANIFLQNDWNIGATSNENGLFLLEVTQENKSDTLIVSFIGFREAHFPLSDYIGKNATIELEPFAQLLRESVVTARRIIAEEFSVKQMKQMDIYLNPASKVDPLLAINAMAASTTIDESANISLRGSRPDETGIYLNDVPVYDAIRFSQLDGVGTFSIFNTDVIERMHVFAGNPPVEYGNTASGLVSLQTHNNIPVEPLNTIALSLANIGGLTSRKIGDKSAIIAFGNYQPSAIFTGLNQESMQDLKKFNSTDLGLHAIHNFNDDVRIKVFNYSNKEGYEFNQNNPSHNGVFGMNKLRNYTIANFIKQNTNSELTVNGGYNISRESFKYSITDITINKQDVYFSTSYQYFFDKLTVKSGISVDYRENDSKGTKAMYYYAQDINHPKFSFDTFESYFLPEAYLYGKYKLNSKLIIGTGLRKNVKIDDQPDYLSYQANVSYRINNTHSFNLSGGHYNKLSMPNAESYEITLYESNQLSLDYAIKSKRIEIQSALFTKNTNHGNYTDLAKGVEFYAKINIKPIELQFSFTAIDAEIKEGAESHPSRYDLGYFVRSVLKYTLMENFEISAIYIFRQGNHYLPVNGSYFEPSLQVYSPTYSDWSESERLPNYHKIDISISKYWVVNSNLALVLFANGSNILNTKNVREVNYNSDYSTSFNELYSERVFYFGVSFMF